MADERGDDQRDQELRTHREPAFSPFARRVATVLGAVTITAVLILLVWQLITLLLIVFLGVLFAIFLRGLTNFAIRHTPLRDPFALFVVLLLLLLVFGGAGWLMAPPINDQSGEIATAIPRALQEIERWLESGRLGQRLLIEVRELPVESVLGSETLGQVGGAFFGAFGVLSYFAFVVIVGVYLAYAPEIYKRGILRLVPMDYRDRAREVIQICAHQLSWWLLGRLISMFTIAVLTGLGLWALGIPLPFILGVMAGVFSFVPILGSFGAYIPAALMALLVGPSYVLWTGLVFIGAQFVESNFVEPIVQQRLVSLAPALLLSAEVVAALLFGVPGVIVATPLAVLAMTLINMLYVEDVLGDRTPFTDMVEQYGGRRALK